MSNSSDDVSAKKSAKVASNSSQYVFSCSGKISRTRNLSVNYSYSNLYNLKKARMSASNADPRVIIYRLIFLKSSKFYLFSSIPSLINLKSKARVTFDYKDEDSEDLVFSSIAYFDFPLTFMRISIVVAQFEVDYSSESLKISVYRCEDIFFAFAASAYSLNFLTMSNI